MRALVDIPEVQVQALAEICRMRKISRAEAVRQAIATFIEGNKPVPVDAFGLWKSRAVDSLAWQEKVRSEW